MPTDLPRRQTTSQFRPVRASRVNASFSLAGSVLGSSIVTFAPVVDISCTTHGRAANDPAAAELDVPDPYYGAAGGFEEVLDLVQAACRGLLEHIGAGEPA